MFADMFVIWLFIVKCGKYRECALGTTEINSYVFTQMATQGI